MVFCSSQTFTGFLVELPKETDAALKFAGKISIDRVRGTTAQCNDLKGGRAGWLERFREEPSVNAAQCDVIACTTAIGSDVSTSKSLSILPDTYAEDSWLGKPCPTEKYCSLIAPYYYRHLFPTLWYQQSLDNLRAFFLTGVFTFEEKRRCLWRLVQTGIATHLIRNVGAAHKCLVWSARRSHL
jgi:hypothetical protein